MCNSLAFRFTPDPLLAPVVTSNPPKPYDEAETAYVRHRIATGEYEDRETREAVNELLRLEQYVQDPPEGFGGGVQYGKLRNKHPVAYDAIQAELDPAGFERRRERERDNREEDRAYEIAVREEQRQAEREADERRHEREWAEVERDRRQWEGVAE